MNDLLELTIYFSLEAGVIMGIALYVQHRKDSRNNRRGPED